MIFYNDWRPWGYIYNVIFFAVLPLVGFYCYHGWSNMAKKSPEHALIYSRGPFQREKKLCQPQDLVEKALFLDEALCSISLFF